MSRRTGPTPTVRAAVWDRDGGACAWCGTPITGEHSLQHRRARGMGGTKRADTNSPANLVLTCGSATTGCHGWIESHPREAERREFRLRQLADPADVPLLYRGARWVRLDHHGGITVHAQLNPSEVTP